MKRLFSLILLFSFAVSVLAQEKSESKASKFSGRMQTMLNMYLDEVKEEIGKDEDKAYKYLKKYLQQAPDPEALESGADYIIENYDKVFVKAANRIKKELWLKNAPVALTNIILIDGSLKGGPKKCTVIYKDGKITDILRPGSDIPASAKVEDMSDYYMTPGFIDAHIHLATNPTNENYEFAFSMMRDLFAHGITAVRDMAGDGRALHYYKRQTQLQEKSGPDIFFSTVVGGPKFFSDPRVKGTSQGVVPGTGSWAHLVTFQTDYDNMMQRVIGAGATGVKLYQDIDADVAALVSLEARKAGLKVWGHWATFPAMPIDIVKAGVEVVSHADMVNNIIPFKEDANREDLEEIVNSSEEIEELWAEMVKRGTILDATMSVYNNRVANTVISSRGGRKGFNSKVLAPIVLRSAKKAGVIIAAGSDNPGDGEVPGGHVEFRMLNSEVGMTPQEVLHAATVVNAVTIGREEITGVIGPGKEATFLLFRTNPLDDVKSWATPEFVVKRGVIYSGEQLRDNNSEVKKLTTFQ